MTGALAPPAVRASESFSPPAILASEAALSRPSAVSLALSQMLADPLWQRGLHPKLRPPVADSLIRRVEYCQPREPLSLSRRVRPSSAPGLSSVADSFTSAAPGRQRSSAVAAPPRLPSAGNSRSSSRSSMEVSETCEDYHSRGARVGDGSGSDGSFSRSAAAGERVVTRRGLTSSEPRSNSSFCKPPVPRANNAACRPPVVPRLPSRKQSLESSEEDSRSRSGSFAIDADSYVALPRSLSRRRPVSAGPHSTSRSVSVDRVPSNWPTPARSRCRPPSLGRCSDEERAVPTIRAPSLNCQHSPSPNCQHSE